MPASVEVAEPAVRTLAHGVKIHTLASDDFEVLRVTFVFAAGTSAQQVSFSASAAANLLAEGTRDCTAHEIAERLDYYGSYFDVNIDRDMVYVSFCMLSKFVAPTLELAEQILLHPLFPDEEVAAYRAKRKQQLLIERTKVNTQASEAFAQALFGPQHPYGRSSEAELYDRLTRTDIVEFYTRHYTAENCFVVCSGRVGETEQRAIDAIAAQLPAGGSMTRPQIPAPETQHELFVEHAGAVQSAIRVGRMLFPRQHPDFVGMQVVAMALGGYFGARLMQNLREKHGYTYGAAAATINFQQAGYLAIATQVGTEVTQAALHEIHAEIARLRDKPMPAAELEMVKNMMAGEMMRILDGPFGIADVTIENLLCGMSNSVIGKNLRRIRETTPEEVQRLARRDLAREDLVTVVAGADLG
ncbi:MAG: insulinase family protein [Alistipes sp.]|nr:insulinase family protein [Alistipes sp.]